MKLENMVRYHHVNNGVVGGPKHNAAEDILGIVEDAIGGPQYNLQKEGDSWVAKPTEAPYVLTSRAIAFHCEAVLEVHRTNSELEIDQQAPHAATVSVAELQLINFE